MTLLLFLKRLFFTNNVFPLSFVFPFLSFFILDCHHFYLWLNVFMPIHILFIKISCSLLLLPFWLLLNIHLNFSLYCHCVKSRIWDLFAPVWRSVGMSCSMTEFQTVNSRSPLRPKSSALRKAVFHTYLHPLYVLFFAVCFSFFLKSGELNYDPFWNYFLEFPKS